MSKKKKHLSSKRKSPRRPAKRKILRRISVPRFVPLAVADCDFASFQTYLEAHALLPYDFEGDRPEAHDAIQDAFTVVADTAASAGALLRAVVVLGHTPTVAALEVLQHHAASDRPHATVARFAADECRDWISYAQTSPSLLN